MFGKPTCLYSIQTACHTTHAFTNVPYSSCLLYQSHTFTYHVLCSIQMPVVSLSRIYRSCTVQHSNCLSYHSHIYRSCTVQHSNCHTTLTHIQIMYCTEFKLPVIPLSHLPTVYCTAFKMSVIPLTHLQIMYCTTVKLPVVPLTNLQISCTVQQSNCLW